MNRQLLLVVAVIGLFQVASTNARDLRRWGTATDPDGDCTFDLAKRVLTISVPGHAHDLAADIDLTNAPRVLQTVRGDFTIQVRVDGRFEPGDESTKAGRIPYSGAGLVAIADAENVVTLARAALQKRGKDAESYANFEMRAYGQLQRIGMSGDHPLAKDQPTYLRLERRGAKMQGAVSRDGCTWDALEAKEIPSAWPAELQVGVVAISTSKDEFNPRFSKLQVLK